MSSHRKLTLLATAFGLCSLLGMPAPAAAEAEAETATETEEPVTLPVDPASLPAQELTPRILYTFLLAEIAGARGQLALSVDAYLDLARNTRDPRIARRATEIALYSRDVEAASAAAEIWAESDPTSAEAQRVLTGVLAGSDGRLDSIQLQLARILAQSPERLEANLLGLNNAFARVTDKKAVRAVIERLTEPYLDYAEAHFARAQAAVLAGDETAAHGAIDAALQARAGWEPAVLFKAQLLLQSGKAEDAVALLESQLALQPDSRALRMGYARGLVSARRFDAARDQFRILLDAAPEDRDLNYAVALLSAQLEEFDTASRLFIRALEAGHPEADGIRMNLAQIAERRGQPEEAIRWYREIASGRHHADAQMRLATLLSTLGRHEEALQHLRSAGDEGLSGKRLLLAETQLLRDMGRDAEAFARIEAALAVSPDDPELLYESSMLAEQVGQFELMEKRLRKLIAQKPDHAHAHNALGYSLADRGQRLDEAESLIARALELAPSDPFILDSMGWVRFRRGDASGALELLQRAWDLRQDPEIAAHLGEVLWALERRDEAQRVWSVAREAHPENKALRETVRRLQP